MTGLIIALFVSLFLLTLGYFRLWGNYSSFKKYVRHTINYLVDSLSTQTPQEESVSKCTDVAWMLSVAASEQTESFVKAVRTVLSDEYVGQSNSKVKEYTGRQKVAILLIALGVKVSTELFKYLREDEIEVIAFEVSRIDSVDYENKNSVMEEFHELLIADQFISTGGIDYARELLEKSLGSQKAIDIINRLTSSLHVRPFDFIRRVDPSHLLSILQQEHPQIVALIISYLEPNKASVILQNLPAELQSDVSRRIATLDRTSPEILREIERVLEKKLSTLSSEDYAVAGGVESIVEILNFTDRASEKQIIDTLEDEDPELAEEIKKRMFIFEDIVMLDDRTIQRIMREVDSQELVKALKSVDSEVQGKIFKNMSKRAESMLKEDMEYMGPVRLKDVEEVQQKIVAIIRHLENTGEIVIARRGEDAFIV